MIELLLGFMGLVLLIFCLVDLWHLKEFLKVMKKTNEYLAQIGYQIQDMQYHVTQINLKK